MADLIPFPSVVLDRLSNLGVDVDRALRRANILRSRFQGFQARLASREVFAFWRAVEEVFGYRDIGLRIGSEALPHQLDIASLAALHSANLGEALKKFSRYKRLVCGERVSLESMGGEARIGFHWTHVEESQPLLLVDATFATLIQLAKRGLGSQLLPIRLELARRRSEQERTLQEHFGCAVQFDAPMDILVLAQTDLARSFSTHNADLLAVLIPGLEAALRADVTLSQADEVRTVLAHQLNGSRPSIGKLASELGMSQRTLQRRLGEWGTTYQSLLDQVRRNASLSLLRLTDLEPTEVAFVLGFEEVNSFARAFHRWEGVTPTRWRQSQGTQRAPARVSLPGAVLKAPM